MIVREMNICTKKEIETVWLVFSIGETAVQVTQVPSLYRLYKEPSGAQRLINLEIPVLIRSLKSSNVELG